MKNVVILHGISGTPNDFWFPWVAKQLEKKGYTVSVPQLPDADNPQADTWLPAALKETITPETVLISHSASGTLILRILEQIDVQIKQAILVAGFAKPKKGYTLPEGILKKTYDWKRIGEHVEDIIFINSDNDPWGADDEQGRYMLDHLGKGKLIVMKGEGHMGSEMYKQPYKEFPFLLKLID
jgi:predicted alpha/beta hydrolase family esterase